ncbi:MAG: DUF177 domain-containing protein [Chlorobiales bacterium]|nr:DUF177 domain-containing protein [Chlorobiales bacterium]
MLGDSVKKGLIVIKVANLSLGEHCYEFQCTAADFDAQEVSEQMFSLPIVVRVVLNKTTAEIVADIETETTANLECDRCLAPIHKAVKGQYKLFYLMRHFERHSMDVDEETEVRQIDKNTVEIDLTEDVRETLLLSIPLKNTCDNLETCALSAGKEEEVVYRYGEQAGSEQEETEWQTSLKQLDNKLNTTKKRNK